MRTLLVVGQALTLAAVCGPMSAGEPRSNPSRVVSFLGTTLTPVELSESVRAEYEIELSRARADFADDPEAVEPTIWLGRRLAYLGRYREAIDVFSRGIDLHPREPRLYRHRGHRYITVRNLSRAVQDLETAVKLIAGTADRIEPDGLPNAAGIPTSTLHSNIWYHLGLARYLQGEFEQALTAYETCLALSQSTDMRIATAHWLYMTLRRLGFEERAREVIEPIRADLEILENHEYHRLLLMYQAERPFPPELEPEADGVASATLGYGIANWHLYNGRADLAERLFLQILAGNQWAAFGYIAAEAEVARGWGRELP